MAGERQRSILRVVEGECGSRPRQPAVRPALHGTEFAQEVLEAGIEPAYQPIVHLGSGAVLAHEALARPRHPDMGDEPRAFFRVLEQAGLRRAGERAALTAAIDGLPGLFPAGRKLFLNASPTSIIDEELDLLHMIDLAARYGLAASDLVVEVTESEAVHDMAALAGRSRRLRRLGIGLAVDDAGAGHSSFKVVTRLRPAYIKIDGELVHNVDTDGARHAFIDALVRFARRIGSRLVAEGVETQGELASLTGLGVEAAQGFFIAHPAKGELPLPTPEARRTIAAAAQRLRMDGARLTAGELARPVERMACTATVREVYGRFLADPSLGTLVLVDEDDRTVAAVARRLLDRTLATPDAWEEVADSPAMEQAERHPLTVPAELEVSELAEIVAARRPLDVPDDLVVADPRNGVTGVVAVRELVRALADARHHGEYVVNPLSGLLGIDWMEEELARRLRAGQPLTVLFLDVDRFRTVNHLGGFVLGDKVIRALGRCLDGVAAGVQGAAVAHAGADDFVLVAPPHRSEELITEVVRSFERELVPFLRVELRLREAARSVEDVTLSMAAVDVAGDPPAGHRYLEWAGGAGATLLQVAKDQPCHACVQQRGDAVRVSTWRPTGGRERRTIPLGAVEPATVLAAVELLHRAWERAWQRDEHGETEFEVDRFPGPKALVHHLEERFGQPLRERAQAALESGEPLMDVSLEGEEAELLELLDRVALITREAQAACSVPAPPEIALIDRLLHERARAVRREDRSSRSLSPGRPYTPPRARTSSIAP
jgi:EAL domain-containing protein (putative c-di-GMP-specific phosphodiesterase class I)/GGDEF domain-containing protein